MKLLNYSRLAQTLHRLILGTVISATFIFSSSSLVMAANTNEALSTPDLYAKGVNLVRQGNMEEAKVYLDKVIANSPDKSVEVYSLLANGYMAKQDASTAIKEYRKALKLEPGNTSVLLGLTQAYQVTGQKDKVIEVYEELVLRNPTTAIYPYNLANIYMSNNQYNEAAEYFQKAIDIDPAGLPNVYLLLGYSYEISKRYPDAIDAYLKSIEYHPGSYQNHFNLGNVYYTTKELEKAIDQFKIALKLQPNVAEIHANLAYCYFFQDNYSEAQNGFENALQLKPRLPQGLFGMSMLYNKNNNPEKALEFAEKAQKNGLKVSDKYLEKLRKSIDQK